MRTGPLIPGTWVYPRVREGKSWTVRPSAPTRGLSPRTQWEHRSRQRSSPSRRSIPVHAGKPTKTSGEPRLSTVYPRARGENPWECPALYSLSGLSPLKRGNLGPRDSAPQNLGPIPAHTAETSARPAGCPGILVDPRARGGSTSMRHGMQDRLSIPAHARQTTSDWVARCAPWVYPHARGGIDKKAGSTPVSESLSPRTRGNWRYPHRYLKDEGLSPGTRGNLTDVKRATPRVRSIPADAVGTASRCCREDTVPVYPHAGGGERGGFRGLAHGSRSIPAHAGGTPSSSGPGPPKSVYPRAREGNTLAEIPGTLARGLSPRTRENRPRVGLRPPPSGSIPAHAGQQEIRPVLHR